MHDGCSQSSSRYASRLPRIKEEQSVVPCVNAPLSYEKSLHRRYVDLSLRLTVHMLDAAGEDGNSFHREKLLGRRYQRSCTIARSIEPSRRTSVHGWGSLRYAPSSNARIPRRRTQRSYLCPSLWSTRLIHQDARRQSPSHRERSPRRGSRCASSTPLELRRPKQAKKIVRFESHGAQKAAQKDSHTAHSTTSKSLPLTSQPIPSCSFFNLFTLIANALFRISLLGNLLNCLVRPTHSRAAMNHLVGSYWYHLKAFR